MIRRIAIDIAIGLFIALALIAAQYGTTSSSSTFIYQGF
jgi:hypothetical protein